MQAVAQSSETIRTKNLSYLEKKAKRDCPDTTDIHKSSFLWKLWSDLEERAWFSTPKSSYKGVVFKLTR